MNDLEIRKCRLEDLPILGELIPNLARHKQLFGYQERMSRSAYLIGWLEDRPVGHLFLDFDGPGAEFVKEKIKNTPEISALETHPEEMRSRGIGSALLAEAERMCAEEGFARVGLTVAMGNNRAEGLYKRLGYEKSDIGEFDNTWYEIQDDGSKLEVVDHCMYLVKNL